MGLLNKILNIFTGTSVKWAGVVISFVLGSVFLEGNQRVGFLVCVSFAVFCFLFPKLFLWIEPFADHENWLPFVSLGIAILFAAHQGGSAAWAIAGPLTTYDGMYFPENY